MHSCYLQHAAQIDASNTNAQTTSQKQQAIQLNTNEIQPIHSQAQPNFSTPPSSTSSPPPTPSCIYDVICGCPPGCSRDLGSLSRSQCPKGFYSSACGNSSAACSMCPAGSYCEHGRLLSDLNRSPKRLPGSSLDSVRLDDRCLGLVRNPQHPPDSVSSQGESWCSPVAAAKLSRDSVIVFDLPIVLYMARRNRWVHPWKTMVILSLFARPLAVLVWRLRRQCALRT